MPADVGHPIIYSVVVFGHFREDVVVMKFPSLQVIRNVESKPVRVVPTRGNALGVILIARLVNCAVQEELVLEPIPLINTTIVSIDDVSFGIHSWNIVMYGHSSDQRSEKER